MSEAAEPGPSTDQLTAAPPGFGALRALLAVVPPVTAMTALMFYFGWARSYSEARFLGADASVFGYSVQDYLLRSVDSLFLPFILVTALALGWVVVHQRVVARLARRRAGGPTDRPVATAGLALLVTGVLLTAYGILYGATLYRYGRRFLDLTGPAALGLGLLLVVYGAWLRHHATAAARTDAATVPSWTRPLAGGLVVTIVGLSLFWAVGNFATWRGRDLGLAIAQTFRSRPDVVVYSTQRLGLTAAGVKETLITGKNERYKARYEGLHLLDRANGTYLLMPDGWSFADRTLVVLPDSPDQRVEIVSR